MQLSGQLYTPASLSPGKIPPVPTEQEAMCAPDPVWTLWRGDKSVALREIEPRLIGHVGNSLVTILTVLPRLSLWVRLFFIKTCIIFWTHI